MPAHIMSTKSIPPSAAATMHWQAIQTIQFKLVSQLAYKSHTTAVGGPSQPMARTEDLPAYSATDGGPNPGSSPPSYDDMTFTIGSRTVTPPLVSIGQLKSHLRLLGMFALMKRKIENPDSDPQLAEAIPLPAKALPPEERWVWFLELAVERYVIVRAEASRTAA